MKICPQCRIQIASPEWHCGSCGWSIRYQDNIGRFSEIADSGYDPAWYTELARLEAGNFWFRARNRLIATLVRRHVPARAAYLEIGCGSGFVLQMLAQEFPGWSITATEYFAEGLEIARARAGDTVTFYQMDARNIPFREEFDVVGGFDVIEHIEQDEEVLRQIHASLKPGGLLLLSVPQHMFLWSAYDEAGHHYRRYSKSELLRKMEIAGFTIAEATSFNSILFPLMVLSRWLGSGKKQEVDVLSEMHIPAALNKILHVFLTLEYWIYRAGLRWPFGGSLLVVGKKEA